ncbi:CGNR zinc finger domain-containing protein [Bosea sp. (in: a-proteobacteria)]|uniref:CGNR zinc finger domain-containing protein n=1 Tax=Bosea sp. (in: a-proteobacteria) TaxID=1871050 RepID=UPI001ACB1E85|nr:CGNR zinc finger domain-containing protein [Bosea sp. (in: a-proteobacteria)]MBN9444125.1 CGNR zinc finger domain-containing protein [Bosea sp. (in: a-proteobacteria)]
MALATGDQRSDEFRHGFPFVGGRLWLDLLNTVVSDGVASRDLLAEPGGPELWRKAAGIDAPLPASGSAALSALRELLRPAVALLRGQRALPAELLERINGLLAEVSLRSRLVAEDGSLRLESWLDPGAAGPAGAVAENFARFVCEAEPERLKHCSNPSCSLVFYDGGKNNTRRWCSMNLCGNRDKVARYRARRRESPKTEG